ncbi:polar amino acid ABC transporter [Aeromonas veronii]|nr:polar amino acid ABC transporter [Aeromonas veronii]HEA3202678.1 transporter substrate-binding domain-containing protein [Aeromonas veronii]
MLRFLFYLFTLFFLGEGVAKEIKVGVSFSIPPYVIDGGRQGVEVDLLKEAFLDSRHNIKVVALPLERTFRFFSQKKLDAIINVERGMIESELLTDPVITFYNMIFTISNDVNSVSDLTNKRVVAFQRAKMVLGRDFYMMAKSNPNYREHAKQQLQVLQLMRGRVDALVMEEYIFYYYLNKLINHENLMKGSDLMGVKIINTLPPVKYHFAFHDSELREIFNRQLGLMQTDGRYKNILQKYGLIK